MVPGGEEFEEAGADFSRVHRLKYSAARRAAPRVDAASGLRQDRLKLTAGNRMSHFPLDRPRAASARPTPSVGDLVRWDVRNWSRALEFWQGHSTQDLSHCAALEIGARKGGLSLWLALQGATVVCSDLKGPTEQTIQYHREQGASGITYSSVDARAIPYAECFDVVLFKSVLGYLGIDGSKTAQEKAITEMHKALKPGGELLFAENLCGSPLHRLLRRCYRRQSRWRYLSLDEIREMLAPFSHVSLKAVGVTGALGRNPLQQEWLGTIDAVLLDRVMPDRWKYIVVGVARKA
jgi:2-polyprenyl-3-methyl-5-hydroxy-6-metoxy-1,4-benzoquinol methylase